MVVVGSAARDVAADDPRGWRLGGGAAYGSLTLARLGVRTACLLGVDEPAATAAELDVLRAAGVELQLVPLVRGPIFENVETPTGRRQTCHSTSDPIPTSVLPEAWASAHAFLLAPVADEVPQAWATLPQAGATVALGWQGLLRDLGSGQRVRKRPPAEAPLLRRADIVGLSPEDVTAETPIAALTVLLRGGATLLLTRGPAGGLALVVGPDGEASRTVRFPAIPAAAIDPTGAGDIFLAALLATRLRPRLAAHLGPRGDLRLAAAAAALGVEGEGLSGIAPAGRVIERAQGSVARPMA